MPFFDDGLLGTASTASSECRDVCGAHWQIGVSFFCPTICAPPVCMDASVLARMALFCVHWRHSAGGQSDSSPLPLSCATQVAC